MKKNLSRMGLPVGFLVLILLLLIPTPPELSTAGHRMLAILVFSVIIWMTEAVAYPVSAGIIMSLMAFLLGTAPNMVNPSKMLGTTISWLDWFIAAAPFAIIMSVILYFVLLKLMPPEMDEVPGGKEKIAQELAALGPMKADEKKLMFISVVLFFFWATEKIVHPFDTSSTTIVAVTLMMMPGIGIMTWKEVQERINWGTLLLFGVGISLGSAILSTKAGEWIAHVIVEYFGLYDATATFIIAILALFLILIHLGFASATALSSAMIPICISVLQGASENMTLNVVGMVMILQYTICFGFILPVNAPQNMIAYSTDTFEVKDFIKTGIPLTIFAYLTILLLTNTYWKWLGLVL